MSTSSPAFPLRDERQLILQRYQQRFATHGPSVAALASGSEGKQRIRHQILREIGIADGQSVLDVGCGLGHFLAGAEEAGLGIRYTGLDFVPEFIAHCKAAWSGEAARCSFIEADLFHEDCAALHQQERHDFVVASQVFNNRYAENSNWNLLETALKAMYDICNIGVAIDCLTTQVDFEEPHLYYYDPGQLLKLGISLTRRAVLRHDYPLYEQTLYLYRDSP